MPEVSQQTTKNVLLEVTCRSYLGIRCLHFHSEGLVEANIDTKKSLIQVVQSSR